MLIRIDHKEENKKYVDMIEKILSEPNIEDINIPDILARVLYNHDIELDHLYYGWLSDHYFMLYIPKIIENIMFIQKYLIKNRHTFINRGGHGNGDSYVYYIPFKDMIVQCYKDQNINFICIYNKGEFREYLHIRRFWERNSKKRYVYKPTLKMFRDTLNNSSICKGYPIRYGDGRDPGYILTYDSFKDRIDSSAYSQGLIRHAIFNINSQAEYFKDSEMG